jgi:hypothetical protein
VAMASSSLKQDECAENISLNKGIGLIDTAIYMRFRREVHDRINFGRKLIDKGGVGDVAMYKLKARICFNFSQILSIASVCELVQHHDGDCCMPSEDPANER